MHYEQWMWKKLIGKHFNFDRFRMSPSTAGKRELPCRCRQGCGAERVSCGIDG
jgi:hypothetical protein